MKGKKEPSLYEMKDAIFKISDSKDEQQFLDALKEFVDLEELIKEPPQRNSKFSETLAELSRMYSASFVLVSQKTENWASHRRLFLKSLDTAIASVTKIKLYSCQSKIAFSAIDVLGTSASLLLERFQKNWATTLLYTSAGFGCLSFITSMFDLTKTAFIMEEVLKKMRTDSEYLGETQDALQKMYDFDRSVRRLFPHGIDARVVKLIQKPHTARRSKPENVISALSESSQSLQIFLSVLISNLRADPNLLEDKEFIANVRTFSKSCVGEMWWKRMIHNGMLPVSQKTRLFTYLNSLSRIESMPIRTFPLLSAPVWHLNSFPTVGAIFMNSLVIFDSYCDLIQNGKTREADLLQELQQTLQVEYKKIMDVYQQLIPYKDD